MTAKEYMVRVRKAETELKLLASRRRHYEDLLLSLSSNPDAVRVQHGISSKTETVAVGLVSLIGSVNKKTKEYEKVVSEAEQLISKLSQEKFRQILTLYYLSGWSWKSIRDELGYRDEKSVYRCHGYALRELQKLL